MWNDLRDHIIWYRVKLQAEKSFSARDIKTEQQVVATLSRVWIGGDDK